MCREQRATLRAAWHLGAVSLQEQGRKKGTRVVCGMRYVLKIMQQGLKKVNLCC